MDSDLNDAWGELDDLLANRPASPPVLQVRLDGELAEPSIPLIEPAPSALLERTDESSTETPEPQVTQQGGVISNTTPLEGRVEKRPPRSLKEKREKEARQFPSSLLGNLEGTTSAEVRKMNHAERELVLYKRKLRNRESARRSRQKRQATIAELQDEIDDLMKVSGKMVEYGLSLRAENDRLKGKLDIANAEIRALRAVYPHAAPLDPTAPLKMKLGG